MSSSRLNRTGVPYQIVVLDRVTLGIDNPYAGYARPAFFTIVERIEEPDGRVRYLLRDTDGNRIPSRYATDHDISEWLVDVKDWALEEGERVRGEMGTRDSRYQKVVIERNLLRAIIAEQTVRVITPEQARGLGIGDPIPSVP